MKNIEIQFNRWIKLLRFKAEEYEHPARREGKEVSKPDLDSICNEMEAFKNGVLIKEDNYEKHY